MNGREGGNKKRGDEAGKDTRRKEQMADKRDKGQKEETYMA